MEEALLLKAADLDRFVGLLSSRYEVYFPSRHRDHRFFRRYTDSTRDALLGEVRPVEPLKAFFSSARERVAEDFNDDLPLSSRKPFAILGVKSCDLKGFRIQDHVFKRDGFLDPFYIRNREQNLIIGADCTCAIDTCFCLALGLQPHPQQDFDLNFSPTPEGFVVEAGAPKGRAILGECASLFHPATPSDIQARQDQRAQVRAAVERNLTSHDIPSEDQFAEIIEQNWTSAVWRDEAATCVECGACTHICPTCHCFLLYDQKDERRMARLRVWDSCLLKDYARVAGGANPRRFLWMRLRNRFDKKFSFFPKVANVYACTGCGRCVSACPGKIDIRRILRRLVNHA